MKRTLVIFFALILSCSKNTFSENENRILLFKSVQPISAINLNLEKFWEVNSEEKTFVIQELFPHHFQQIRDSVVNLKMIKSTQEIDYNDFVRYAIVNYKKEKNDTLYFDGFNKWWILNNGILNEYVDEDNSLTELLKNNLVIFNDCQ